MVVVTSTALAVMTLIAILIASAPGTSAADELFQFEYFTRTNFSPFHLPLGFEFMGSVVTSRLRALRRGGNEIVTKKYKKRKEDNDDDDHTYDNQVVGTSNGAEEEWVKETKASKEKDDTDTIVDEPVGPNQEEEDINPVKETEDEDSKAAKASKKKNETKKSKESPENASASEAEGISTFYFLIYGIIGVLVLLGIIVAVIYSRSQERKGYSPIG
ncbi:hypothetical protein ACHAW6_011597 [Cyclotella cf. meneghiniana]